jgi:hypothetical protein
MSNYKITNITDTTGKRNLRFNSILDIDYVDEMQKKSIKIKPGETVFLQIHSLPLSVHKLRVRKLVSVVEISNNELKNNMNIAKPIIIPSVIETPEEKEIKVESIAKRKSGKKSVEVVDSQ